MLRCTVLGLLLTMGLAVSADEPADDAANDAANDEVSSVEATSASGKFRYRMTLKTIKTNVEGITCSQGRYTGSKKRQNYCRTDEMAQKEEEAAREFLKERMRNKH